MYVVPGVDDVVVVVAMLLGQVTAVDVVVVAVLQVLAPHVVPAMKLPRLYIMQSWPFVYSHWPVLL
jgi:hypothetical protein